MDYLPVSKDHRARRLAFLGLLCLLCILSPALVSAEGVQITLQPASQTIDQGAEVTVSAEITGSAALAGCELHLRFDPAILQVVDADSKQAGVQVGGGTIFTGKQTFVINKVDNAKGTIDYAVALMGETEGVSKGGSALVIRFRGQAGGTSQIAFAQDPPTLLSDISGRGIVVSLQGATIKVTGPAAPATATPANTPTVPAGPPAATGTPAAGPTAGPATTAPRATAQGNAPTVTVQPVSTAAPAATATSAAGPLAPTTMPSATSAPAQREPTTTARASESSGSGTPAAPTAVPSGRATTSGLGVVLGALGALLVAGALGGLLYYGIRRPGSGRP